MVELKAKITLMGDNEVGKTSLILRYVKNRFTSQYKPTLGADFMAKRIEFGGVPNKIVTLAIWDLAGQEQFCSLREYYLLGTLVAIICFDLTQRSSFQHIPNWIKETRDVLGDIPIVIVGTKQDLTDQRKIITSEIADFIAKQSSKKLIFFETSSATQYNVNEVFKYIIDNYILTEFPG